MVQNTMDQKKIASGNNEKSNNGSDSVANDNLFDPSVDMLVNDFDDERTLEEEEALAAGETNDPSAELSTLEKEGNMPLEELLALYGYKNANETDCSSDEEKETDEIITQESTEEKKIQPVIEKDRSPLPPKQPSKLRLLYEPMADELEGSSKFLKSVSKISDDEEGDNESGLDDDCKKIRKTIMVGSDYQAHVPEGLCHYDDVLPYENDDKLIWDPSEMHGTTVEAYLKKAHTITRSPIPTGTHLRDDEHALYLLQQCGHSADEALRRLSLTIPSSSTDAKNEYLWSEEECQNFEAGIRNFGKNFRLIQQTKVRTRSVGELVQFYYLWKKSERHDVFANKARLEKKKYSLHPGLTDFMDRFLEDQERDRSSSPNIVLGSGNSNSKPPDT